MLCFDLQKQRYRAAINRKKRFRNPDKQPLPFDPDIVGRVVASQQAFRNRNYLEKSNRMRANVLYCPRSIICLLPFSTT